MKTLDFDLREVVDAMDSMAFGSDSEAYLNLKTGKVIYNSDEMLRGEPPEVPDAGERPDDYLFLRPFESPEKFRIMEDFAHQVENERDRNKLMRALGGRKPFRNFRDKLHDLGGSYLEKFYDFEKKGLDRIALGYLVVNGVER